MMNSSSKSFTADQRKDLFFRRWILLLIAAASNAGIENVSRQQFHRMLYLSFSTSKFYGITPLAFRPRQTNSGPYFHIAHDALLRLVIEDHLTIENFKPIFEGIHFQFDGNFSLTITGVNTCSLFRKSEIGEKLYLFLVDLCLALVDYSDENELNSTDQTDNDNFEFARYDPTYLREKSRGQGVVEFSEIDSALEIPTVAGLHQIRGEIYSRGFIVKRDALRVFKRLLEKNVA
jgi:hypothetical protein